MRDIDKRDKFGWLLLDLVGNLSDVACVECGGRMALESYQKTDQELRCNVSRLRLACPTCGAFAEMRRGKVDEHEQRVAHLLERENHLEGVLLQIGELAECAEGEPDYQD